VKTELNRNNKKYPNKQQSLRLMLELQIQQIKLESLILAQNERWRRALHMQVERGGEQSPVERRTGE
jgi:hypothetical protein